MATAPAELADIMEPQLYGDLLPQATSPPVSIQAEGKVWRATGQPRSQAMATPTD